MRSVPASLLAIALLGGCVRPAAMAGLGAYNCSRASQSDGLGAPGYRVVTLRGVPGGGQVMLDFGRGRQQLLDPVQGPEGRLFANQSFAWRSGPGAGVLTDVERIATYACVRAASPDAPPPSRGAAVARRQAATA